MPAPSGPAPAVAGSGRFHLTVQVPDHAETLTPVDARRGGMTPRGNEADCLRGIPGRIIPA